MRDRQTGTATPNTIRPCRCIASPTPSARSPSCSRSVTTGTSKLPWHQHPAATAGHLLGSAYVVMKLAGGATLLFGGDLGRSNRPVLPDPAAAVEADLVLVESTYGDRDHAPDDNGEPLAEVIRDTSRRGGKVIIPAFAIGRVEELLYWVRRLELERRIPVLPVCGQSDGG